METVEVPDLGVELCFSFQFHEQAIQVYRNIQCHRLKHMLFTRKVQQVIQLRPEHVGVWVVILGAVP